MESNILEALLSTDNTARANAEKTMIEARNTNP